MVAAKSLASDVELEEDKIVCVMVQADGYGAPRMSTLSIQQLLENLQISETSPSSRGLVPFAHALHCFA